MSARIVENNGRAKTSTGFEWIFLCFFFLLLLLLPFVDLFIPLIQKLTRVTIDIMRCIFKKRIESRFDDFSSSSSRAWKNCVKINWSRWKKKKKSSSFRLLFITRETFRSVLVQQQLLTLRLLLMPSNWPAVFSPMLCEPHSSKPILAYVNVIDPIGKMYVNTIKITLYLAETRQRIWIRSNPDSYKRNGERR